MKSIKYLSWEQIFEKKIQQKRCQEFKFYSLSRFNDAVKSIYENSITYLLMYVSIYFFIRNNGTFSQSNVFQIITIFFYMKYPLLILPWAYSNLVNSHIHYKRIKSYLNLTEINDKYIYRNASDAADASEHSTSSPRPKAASGADGLASQVLYQPFSTVLTETVDPFCQSEGDSEKNNDCAIKI